jgi:ethanolamine utilization cobalamin adenosyltransferase
MGKVLSLQDLKQAVFEGKKELRIDTKTILTPSAKDFALTGAIKLVTSKESCPQENEKNTASMNQIKDMVKLVANEKKINLCDDNLHVVANEVYKCINK